MAYLIGIVIAVVLLTVLFAALVDIVPTDELAAMTILETWRKPIKRFGVTLRPFLRTEKITKKTLEIDVEPVSFRLSDGVMVTLDFFLTCRIVEPTVAIFEYGEPFNLVAKAARKLAQEILSENNSQVRLGAGSDASSRLLEPLRNEALNYGVLVIEFTVTNEAFSDSIQAGLAQVAMADLDLQANRARLARVGGELDEILQALNRGESPQVSDELRLMLATLIHMGYVGEGGRGGGATPIVGLQMPSR
jgi:regulator of protease activity HflC (stomatin/prohibitin superfamily)